MSEGRGASASEREKAGGAVQGGPPTWPAWVGWRAQEKRVRVSELGSVSERARAGERGKGGATNLAGPEAVAGEVDPIPVNVEAVLHVRDHLGRGDRKRVGLSLAAKWQSRSAPRPLLQPSVYIYLANKA